MLNREQAREQLQALRIEDWRAQRIAKMANLPEGWREIGWGILGCESNGQPVNTQAALKQLDALRPSERLHIFAVLFPQFSSQVEQAWQLIPRLPYQSDWQRKAFRAPNNPEITFHRRCQWLLQLLHTVEGYEQNLSWFAAWTPYLGWYSADILGILFAAAIDVGDDLGQEIFDILIASARGEHEIGAMDRHVVRALLVASRPDGWEFVENLLLGAQRQEGLRQTILETIDEAHPEAFRQMVRLIIDRDLTRFSATIRAVYVWFGFWWDSLNTRVVKEILVKVWQFLENPEARQAALKSEDAQTVYLVMWTLAFSDAIAAIPAATQLLLHPNVEHRFVAVHLLGQLGLPEAQKALLPALEDEDLRIATRAVQAIYNRSAAQELQKTDLFERLEQILPRFPEKPKKLQPLVWEWIILDTSQQFVAGALVNNLGERSPKRLIPYLSIFSASDRRRVAVALARMKSWDTEIRETFFSLVGDPSRRVREQVLQALAICQITQTEAQYLERLLTRKSGDLRRGILQLLLNQKDEEAIASAERLLSASKSLQRLAGLELLREMIQQEQVSNQCRACAEVYQSQRSKGTEAETQLLESILDTETKEPTLEDALGLIEPKELTQPTPPQVQQPRVFVTSAAQACLRTLDDLIHEHRHTPITFETWQGSEEQLLGNLDWQFPSPNPRQPWEENVTHLPLRTLWETWWQERPSELRDEDGFELLRGIASLSVTFDYKELNQIPWFREARQTLFFDTSQLRYSSLIRQVCLWLIYLYPCTDAIDFLLDAAAKTLTFISPADATTSRDFLFSSWMLRDSLCGWLNLVGNHRDLFPSDWEDSHHIRLWQLKYWQNHRIPPDLSFGLHALSLEDFLIAYKAGGAKEADIIAHLLAAKVPDLQTIFGNLPNQFEQQLTPAFITQLRLARRNFHGLQSITRRKQSHLEPILKELGDRCRQRILEVELQRGDLPTAASHAALALGSVEGTETLVKLLQASSLEKFVRGYTYNNLSKAAVFSHLIRVSFPAESDTPKDFARQVKAAKIPQERLIELAFYAPQWTNYVERALRWSNFAEAVWWIHAHTKDSNWQVDSDIREAWAAQVSERTPLSTQSLIDGAVDLDWFTRIYKSLKAQRWQQLNQAAKYASGGTGHKRAQLFADAMLGRIEKETLVTRITQKRHQDSVRALGLLPLARGKKKRESDLLERYQVIQEFLRTSRKFGSQRQASEKLAAMIAMENLARTTGYPDPQRLEWAMEAQAVADLAENSHTVAIDEVSVSLAITEKGEPELTILKKGKPLKSIPAKLRKNPQIVELKTRKQEIARQASRMRLSLEQAMCRGDRFTAAELKQLCTHPVLAPMLEQLIFIGDDATGYPVQQGKNLQFHDGSLVPIQSDNLRIAHPHDLLATEEWHLWQQECFEKKRTQPFKQVFRELYVLTKAEKAAGTIFRRYEGHQVNPRQALALFGQRGWVSCPEEGVRRTFHESGLSAWVTFLDGFFTPAEVEGLTIEGVDFCQQGEWKSLSLSEIPPRIFSEVMRDLDLVVSVAHQGGVDPEASASTIEMRTALIRETCRLLKLDNVELQDSHVLIEGHLGSYSVHLGSAVVHRQPGGALCIMPVHSQHRGRLFLPFADDDPKTAEVVSKVLLLARDREIKDPTILEQILA
ncbi:MAG: DUF5724 domain-containing protein [Xenococcaceae cyanobacterium]